MKKLFILISILLIGCTKDDIIHFDQQKPTKQILIHADIDEESKVMIEQLENNAFKITGFSSAEMLVIAFPTKNSRVARFIYDNIKKAFVNYDALPEGLTDKDYRNAVCGLGYSNGWIPQANSFVNAGMLVVPDGPFMRFPFYGTLTGSGDNWSVKLKANYALLCVSTSSIFPHTIHIGIDSNPNMYLQNIYTHFEYQGTSLVNNEAVTYGLVSTLEKATKVQVDKNNLRYMILPLKYSSYNNKDPKMLNTTTVYILENQDTLKHKSISDIKPGKVYNLTI